MALVHLTRDVPEKGYTVTEMDCQEEFVERMTKRGWKLATKTSAKKEETKDDFKFSSESKVAEPKVEEKETRSRKAKVQE